MSCEEFPVLTQDQPQASAEALYGWVVCRANEQIGWYADGRKWKRRFSQLFRGGAIVLGGIGGLCPLYAAYSGDADKFPELGYVYIAGAGILVTLDKLYGCSSSWIRFAKTQLNLEVALRAFQMEWAQMQIKAFAVEDALRILNDFSKQVDTIVKEETEAWVTEFNNNLKEMEKRLKTGEEERKPGSIKVVVADVANFKQVEISLAGISKTMSGKEALLANIPPGNYEIKVVGTDASAVETPQTKVVTVAPGAMAVAQITLGG